MNNWQKNKILRSKDFQSKAYAEINNLIVTERIGKQIILSDGQRLTEFMSCSYLGLDQDKRVIAAAINNIHKCGVNFAVARTRLRVEAGVELERYLNKIFNSYCVTFTSLHLIHLGMIPLIASGEMPSYPIKKNGIIFIVDKKAHASIQIQRGLMLQFGEVILSDFSNLDEIESHFKIAYENKKTALLLADGICSMGGLIPVNELLELAEKYSGYVYLDDAHGISIQGKNGCGYVLDQLKTFHPRLFLSISLSKGFGTNGAAIAVLTEEDEKIIRRYANPYLFSNPLPLSIVDSSIESAKIHLTEEIYTLQDSLLKNIQYFDLLSNDSHIKDRVINMNSNSPIRGIKIMDEFQDIAITRQLRERGIAVTAAMYPTVAKGESIIRIALCANHRPEDIKYLNQNLIELVG